MGPYSRPQRVHDTICINPGKLTKGGGGGTFARMSIARHPAANIASALPQESLVALADGERPMEEANAEAEAADGDVKEGMLGAEVAQRCRVEIIRL